MASSLVSPAAVGAAAGGGDITSLVLRAWLEPEAPRLRTRIVAIVSGRGERPVIVTTSVDEACRAVRDWLETLEARGAGNSGDDTVTQKR